ncbi:MAG: PKD repeat protein, partial [Dokdonia sp.]
MMVVLMFSSNELYANISADFVVLQDSGCVPFVTAFIDSSQGNIVYRHWDFGNGNVSTGNNINPSAVYNSAGLYDITLTVSDGVDTAFLTKPAYIQVFSAPVANFFNQPVLTGCVDFPFFVNNSSTSSSLPITSWEWDFDDGSPLVSGLSVTHVYQNPGIFNVTLIVTDTLGCASSKVKASLVNVKPKPMANFFSSDSLSVCGPPLSVNVMNSSTSSNPLTHNWLIGGVAYNTLNVNPTFTQSGGYDAQLIVTSSIGCSDTLSIPNYVWIGTIVASMDLNDTVCLGVPSELINTSQGGNLFTWDYGDGSTGVGDTVTHTYNTTGNQSVTLVSSSGSTCDDTITQDVFVESVQANFSSTPHNACEVPLVVTFTDVTIGHIASWEWRFGNLLGIAPFITPNMSQVQHPINVYFEEGTFDDTLIVTTSNGCIDSLIVPINEEIIITQAKWNASVIKGCAPLDVDFTNTTDSVNRMANWWWDFSDGSPLDYNLNPNHVFTNVGTYPVTLTVVSIDGCTTSHYSDILVGIAQTSLFFPDTIIACASDTITFSNLSFDTSLITDYVWLFGDGNSSGSFEPWHLYKDTGYMDVTLITFYNGCPDTLIIDSALQILGPIITFYGAYNCDSQNVVVFNPLLTGGTNFLWDFGDSTSADSIHMNPSHAYPVADSNYTVSLTVWDTNSGCIETTEELAAIRYLIGKVEPADSTICRYDNVLFNTGNSANAIAFVKWSIDGLTNQKIDDSYTDFTFGQKGARTIYAVVMDQHGCLDTASHDVYVYEPIINFTLSPEEACAPSIVQFTDLSQSDTNIVSWLWDLDNGIISTDQNPSHTYNGNGTRFYTVIFTVTDTFGCANQIDTVNVLKVIEPPSFFSSTDIEICEFSSVNFSNQPSGSYSYFWDFDDGNTSFIKNPTHQYSAPGVYDVSLTVTDSMGCDSTFLRPSFIDVQDTPDANFIANPSVTFCYPASINFLDQSIYQNVGSWTWNFGDSPNDVILYGAGAQNLYTQPGYYDVTMIITTTFGCADTIIKNNFIHIGGPTGKISYSPNIGCVDQDVVFKADSANGDAERFIWDFGDGIVDTTLVPELEINHAYVTPGFFNVSLLITDLQGLCQVSDTATIAIDEVKADFFISDSIGCAPLVFDVLNNSIGEDQIYWLYNGVNYGQAQSDSFFIQNSGTHQIQLIVKSTQSQCVDTMTTAVIIHPIPVLNISPDAVVCIEDSLFLSASGANVYQWSPLLYLSAANIRNPLCLPTNNITYYLTGTDTNNCVAKDSVSIIVQQKPVLNWLTPDTSIFIGAELQLGVIGNVPFTYKWMPEFGMGCSDCPDPWVQPITNTTYTLVYADMNGCFELDTSIVVEVLDEFKVSIPNTFTPGSDNLNDTFIPVIYGVEQLVFMRIFDRWGTLVFETTDIS